MLTASKKVINAWAMFDWANSVYNLVITATFFPIYFESEVKGPNGSETVEFLGMSFINSSLYDYALSVAYLVIALAYPILTSIADTQGNKKNFMRFFCTMGALGCSSLYYFRGTENLWLGIVGLMFGAMGYVGSQVFYNAYLPEIAAPQDQDRISARGFSFGYTGSVVLQLIGFGLVLTLPNKGEATRITFLLVGIWWWGFAQITFAGLPKVQPKPRHGGQVFSHGFAEIERIWRETRTQPVLKRFLRGFFFYSMGVQAIMLAATMFGAKTLGLPQTNLIATIVIIQLLAVVGAISMSRLSARFGNFKVLMGVLLMWLVCCAAAIYAAQYKQQGGNPELLFYGIAVGVGLVMGGVQSLSRSTYSKLMPQTTNTASYFSYYDFNEKLAIVIGIFSFGFIHEATGSMQNSILCLMVFFAIGFCWLFAASQKQNALTASAALQ